MTLRESETIERGAAIPAAIGPTRRTRWMPVVDGAVALAVFCYGLPIVPLFAHDAAHLLGLIALSLLLCASWPLRRRWPIGVFATMLAAAWIQLPLGAPLLVADAMLALGVYHLASRFRWPVSVPAAVLALAWLLVATLPHLGAEVVDAGQLGVLVVGTGWVWTWGTLVRARRQVVAGLRERAEQAERERENAARIAVAQERARIAREIHDVVSHSLSVVSVLSDGAAAAVEDRPEQARAAMLQVRETGRGALAEMRRMLGVLREDEPGARTPQPGLDALAQLVEQSRRAGLPVRLVETGDRTPVPASVGLTVYRLAQEALTNARKHAGGDVSAVEVLLEHQRDGIRVRVRDDGQGPRRAAAGGHGLVGMRERVAAHGGRVRTGPRESGGYEVDAWLPREGWA